MVNKMKIDPILRLKEYLLDPINPTWSSQGLIDMFNDLHGDMREKQQTILPIIDDKYALHDSEMTSAQYHFLREVTLHAVYQKSRVEFAAKDIEWLLKKFEQKPSQQRATLIVMLLKENFNKLSEERKQKIKNILRGTLSDQNWDE